MALGSAPAPYVGRFAPSPTGPLHLGSLICALASFLDARSNDGRWLLRMEDLDPPREQPGAADSILDSLRAHGLYWDGPVLWQSQRHAAYAAVVDQLLESGRAFRCDCSRQMLAQSGGVYRGHCRNRNLSCNQPTAVRLRVDEDTLIQVDDGLQQALQQNLAQEVGDFTIQRKDSLFAYQLAVVLDDAEQRCTHVLRGSDLYDSTPRQIYLQQVLGLEQPAYTHIPVITNAAGQKLSKQTHAPALDNAEACRHLCLALKFLNQATPPAHCNTPDSILSFASERWQLLAVPATMGLPESSLA
ncbi:MAG: tRNA glutamyl-Q(34) synthetase GluQRS [Gammaproteobacteria bacterium]|nr:tRNA glutamyl-Q(34) synthetase GluQRS [Gammaproteobacteria bacterium]